MKIAKYLEFYKGYHLELSKDNRVCVSMDLNGWEFVRYTFDTIELAKEYIDSQVRNQFDS
jgi:hypothetical protein